MVTSFVHGGSMQWDDISHVCRIQAKIRGNLARQRMRKAGFTLRMVTNFVEERSVKPVVDWMKPKDENLAWDHAFLKVPSLTYRIPRESTSSLAENFIYRQKHMQKDPITSKILLYANRREASLLGRARDLALDVAKDLGSAATAGIYKAHGEEEIVLHDSCWRSE